MLLRMPVKGTGVPNDPFRCDLPTYITVALNQTGGVLPIVPGDGFGFPFGQTIPVPAMTALVWIPAEEADALGLTGRVNTVKVNGVDVATSLAGITPAQIKNAIDARYKEHAGAFAPQLT